MIPWLLAATVLAAQASPLPSGPPSPRAHELNTRGTALLGRGEAAAALESFRAAQREAPGWVTPRVNEGIARLVVGRLDEAMALFDAALAAAPDHRHALFNRGLARKRAGLPGAEADFSRVFALDPDDPDALYQLGTARMDARDAAGARRAFEDLLARDPGYLSAYFALGRALLQLGEREKAQVYFDRFQELKESSPMAEAVGQAYGEQGVYSLAEDVPAPPPPAPPASPVRMRSVGAAWGLRGSGWAGSGGIGLVDLDGDGRPELVAPTADRLRVFRNAGTRFVEMPSPLAAPCHGVAAGDVDDDGDVDLLVSTDRGATLLLGEGGLRFSEAAVAAGLLRADRPARGVAFADVDHDGDLDLLVAGAAGLRLVRANGNGTFTDITAEALAGAAPADAFGMAAIDLEGDRDLDIVVTGSAPYALANRRDGTFARVAFAGAPAATGVSVPDLDGDTHPDVVLTGDAPAVLYGDAHLRLARVALALPARTAGIAAADIDNDGLVDLVAATPAGLVVLRNLGRRAFADVSRALGMPRAPLVPGGLAAGDVDSDGDLDLVAARGKEPPLLLRNDGGNARGWLAVDARGLHDNRTGIGTRIDVRAGGRAQRRDVLSGGGWLSQSPLAAHFGLGDAKQASVVRLLWPTGVLQDELDAPARTALRVDELDRKGSSCPILYAWDGQRMRFQADVIGAGVMGQWVGEGARNVSDPDEYFAVEGAALDGGRYRFALVEQMEEITYLDAARVVVVDHPEGVRVLPNERFTGGPPFPDFRVVQAKGPWTPVAAHDDDGKDVLAAVATHDGEYVRVPKADLVGFARRHRLTLDLGPRAARGRPLRLLLRGYTEYFYPRTLYAAAQQGLSPEAPSLDVQRGGVWVKVADLGIPAGLPRWMVVDLGRALQPGERVVRVVSGMEVYWDQILVDDGVDDGPVRLSTLDVTQADLRFHGFPRRTRSDPEFFEYEHPEPRGPYARAAGLYTRYGPVDELLRAADDRFVILAAGDAVEMSFDAQALAPLPFGWARTLLFFAHGYEKDMDDYTAHPLTVEPLPFRAMSAYPYPAGERYPDDPAHLAYRLRYNTRRIGRDAWTTPASAAAPAEPR